MKRWLIAFAITACLPLYGDAIPVTAAGSAARSPIEHTIIVYQENISFDHYFGTFPGVDGIPAGASQSHSPSATYSPFRLDGRTQDVTCDVDHGYADMIKMADHGAMDMFTQLGNDKAEGPTVSGSPTCPSLENQPSGPALSLGYYDGSAGDPSAPLGDYWSLASHYTLADNFFQGVYGPSTPGAEWLVAATNNTDGDPNPNGDVCDLDYAGSMPQHDIPNLGEEASANGVSWAWFQGGFHGCTGGTLSGYSAHHDPFQYFSSTADLSHTYAMDPKLDYADPSRHQRDLSVLYDALGETAINGTVPQLPSVSWVKAGTPSDGHPHNSGPAEDDAFMAGLVNRVKASRYWGHTAIIVAFDETGGWWDHVAPPQATGDYHFATWSGTSPNTTGGCQYPGIPGANCAEAGFGPRMPVLVISPHARKHFIDHDQLDTSSLANWVEWNYGLPALGVWGGRDANAGSLLGAFDF